MTTVQPSLLEGSAVIVAERVAEAPACLHCFISDVLRRRGKDPDRISHVVSVIPHNHARYIGSTLSLLSKATLYAMPGQDMGVARGLGLRDPELERFLRINAANRRARNSSVTVSTCKEP